MSSVVEGRIKKSINMVVSKDTNTKLVYNLLNLIRMFRFITLRACLHGGGRPKVGQVTRLGGVTRQSI